MQQRVPPTKSYVRGEVNISGWLIRETGFSSSLVTRFVSLDLKGNIPGNVINTINQKSCATAVFNLKNEVEMIRERSLQLMLHCQNIYIPFVCKISYPHIGVMRSEYCYETSDTCMFLFFSFFPLLFINCCFFFIL